MTGLSILLLGIGLGLRHATDADHVVVLSALVQREPSVWRTARIAALWGAGNSAAFLGLSLSIVLAGVRLPVAFERIAEVLVAAMLIGFGLWHLGSRRTSKPVPQTDVANTYTRPVLIGLVHGLAGSASIALFAATTIASRPLAAAYLALFGLGTVVGMVALTAIMSRPIRWTMRRDGRWRQAVTVLASLWSALLGVAIFVRMLLSN
jgi:cytochrome c biogenesis protein CcdA